MSQTKSPPQIELNTLIEHYQKGRYEPAQILAKTLTEHYPNHPFGWKVLGALFKQTGKLQDSFFANQKVLEISPNDAEAHNNLGVILEEFGRLEDAEASYKKAIAIKPDYAQAYYNLGITLKELGRQEDAEASYKKAIAIKIDYAEAHYNLGITLQELGRLEDAEASYKKAIAIKIDYAKAHYNLGLTLQVLGRLEDAEASYKKAIAIKIDYAEAYYNLGITLRELGRLEDALVIAISFIKIKSTAEAKKLFVLLIKGIPFQNWNQSLVELVIKALLEPWGRQSYVMPSACRLLKTDKEFLQILKESKNNIYQHIHEESFLNIIFKKEFGASSLLLAILSSSPIPDAEIEIFLTSLRRHFLKLAESVILNEDKNEEIQPLFFSLAKQCFINEYVYFQTPEEIRCSQQLRDRLTKAFEDKQSVPELWVIAVACYFPLYSVAGVNISHRQKWSDDVKSVFRQQITEPLEEMNIRASIPVLTSIDNQISLLVRSQYEENPYPRWVRLPKYSNKKFLNAFIQSKFPLSLFSRLLDDRNPEILIAGCGTGQHSIGTSQEIKGAKILAVDLSLASLAYAKRKTTELDIEFIEYAQADLLKLASIGRTFDVIESSGVLHHLENPFEGWEVLLSLLRPNGLMRLGFYSELARKDIVEVRNLIIQEGIGSSFQEIRNYRKHLLGLKNINNYGFATSSSDFFSTSACRDLLFHVQEHRMNLKILADFFNDHNLIFLGFDVDSSVIRAYKNRFPNDPSATNLGQWHIYEKENPNTFVGMYQFWIQKSIGSLSS
jgi:tetratricopeptide (TPR) repeat protein/2-polyprenyl-3-methyl-5-hydroxy-6-metoxy-1,4-benzoquinol methylase